MTEKRILPELLAPAGTPASALAAFDAGADAIYAGLNKFNARERGENFDADTMAKIVDYAHRNRKKVYVTLNTLIKETELPEVVEMLAALNEISPDALLVQDLGVLRVAREYFPNLELHGSTQMGFHNSAGLAVAEKLGLKRVVLERQVTMDELRSIRKKTQLEIEVFIHGALCCSLSGCCLFSSHMGGYSGNRGKCKQPCRRRYYSKDGNGFFFSPQDLAALELIPELCDIGVESLKIEGRLRQPDYVTAAVSAYRMMLDTPPESFSERIGEARELLSRTCGRKWSTGFYRKESFDGLVKFDSIGATGIRCGSVEAVAEDGFGFTATRRIGLGDRLRIQPLGGDDGPAVSLTKVFVNNQPAKRAKSGDRVFVCCDKPVPERGVIFKIGESFGDYSARVAALPDKRMKVDLDVVLTRNNIVVNSGNTILPEWSYELDLSDAQKRPADAEQLKKEFACADSDRFELGVCNVSIDGSYFLPVTILKELRREFWKFAKQRLANGGVIDNSGIALEQFRRDYTALAPQYTLPAKLVETVAVKVHGAEPGNKNAVRAVSVFDAGKECGEAILPEFISEDRVNSVAKAIENAYNLGIRRFRVTSLYGFALLEKYNDIVITASTPLPVCNSMATVELQRMGTAKVMAHIELEKDSVAALVGKSVVPVELYRHGRPALLTTRAAIPVEGQVHDNRRQEFEVRYDKRSGLTRIFARPVFSIPRMDGVYDYYDLTNATWRTIESETFNYDGELH